MSPDLLRLMSWMSPAFPVGAFAYSHGLERAAADGLVRNADGLADWLGALLRHGSGWNDAVLLSEAWRRAAKGGDVEDVAALAEALCASRERQMEATLLGAAFLDAARAWPHAGLDAIPARSPYPVAVGAVAGCHGIDLADTAGAYLLAFAANLVQAGIRLGVAGQTAAVAIVAALETEVSALAQAASRSTLDDLGGATVLSDIMAMRHETQGSRIFRT